MWRIDRHKRLRARHLAAAALVLGMLSLPGANAQAGDELQLGGFMTRTPGAPGSAESRSEAEVGAGSDLAFPKRYAPSSAGLAPDSGWIDDATVAEQGVVGYFTPRFSGLQFGAAYTPTRPAEGGDVGVAPRGQGSARGNDISLGVNYLDSIWGVDVAVTGGYLGSALPGLDQQDIELSGQNTGLHRYTVGTSIGFSGLRLGGSLARDLGDGPLGVQSWDAGVSYVSGPWTIGVDYLQGDLIGSGRAGADGEALQAGVTYNVGPGIVASFNVMHSSGEDGDGNANSGTLGILGFSYNF